MSFTDELENLGEAEVRKRLVNGGLGSPGSSNYSSAEAWLRGNEIERTSKINIGSISGQQIQIGNDNEQNIGKDGVLLSEESGIIEPDQNKSERRRYYFKDSAIIDKNTSPSLQREIVSKEYRYGILGLVVGLVCMLGGLVLFLSGVAGSSHWTVKMVGAESTISDAAPGAVLFMAGFLIALVTKPSFRHK